MPVILCNGMMQSTKRNKSSSQSAISPGSKSAKAKGKERAVESTQKRPPSQLKQGWALVPLVLNSSDNSSNVDKKRPRSPAKRRSIDDKSTVKSSKKAKSTAVERSIAIEIVSDSDEDEIQEISVASTSTASVAKALATASASSSKAKREVVELEFASQESVKHVSETQPERPVINETFDLDEDDDNEDHQLRQQLKQVSEFADENEVLEDVDNWGDAEQGWRRSRSGSLAESLWDEDFGEGLAGVYDRSGDSDEDIREVCSWAILFCVCHHFADISTTSIPADGKRRRSRPTTSSTHQASREVISNPC